MIDSTEQFMTVLPNLSFAERIKRGRYDWVDEEYQKGDCLVTADQYGEWWWKLFCFRRYLPTAGAVQLIREDGFEPAHFGHILTFGELYPEEQRKCPIIGLGPIADGNLTHKVPVLTAGVSRRLLDLYSAYDGLLPMDRLLGVRRRVA